MNKKRICLFNERKINLARDKVLSRSLILKNAKKEFLKKGFEKASMRTIASLSGLTVGAIYRHFTSKDALFEALVQPTLEGAVNLFKIELELASKKLKDINMKDGSYIESPDANAGVLKMLDYIYDNYDDFVLMFRCGQGTKYENIQEFFVDMEVEGSKVYIEAMEACGLVKNPFTETELHIFCTISMTPLFEVINHKYDYEEAVKMVKVMSYGQYWAWNKICLLGNSRQDLPSNKFEASKEFERNELTGMGDDIETG